MHSSRSTQTVFKTAGLPFAVVRRDPLEFGRRRSQSVAVRVGSAATRSVGCHLGCRSTRRRPPSTPIATAVGRPIDDCSRERLHQAPKYRTTGEVRRAAMEATLSAD